MLSVVIPTHNRSALTVRAIDSVLAQREAGEIEIIVVNDGSTDDTETVLRARYGDDTRVHVITTANDGASTARNVGIRMARGGLIAFLDSDDQWTPYACAVARGMFVRYPDLVFVNLEGSLLPLNGVAPIAHLERTIAPGWSHAGFSMAPLLAETIRLDHEQSYIPMLRGDFFPATVHGDLFSLNGTFARCAAVASAGEFNQRFRYYNDWEFTTRLSLQGPGASLDYEGFQRDVGRADQISRGHPPEGFARRHLFMLHNLPRRFPECAVKYGDVLRNALIDAQYQMGGALARGGHRGWARRYLWRCIRARYKVGKCLVYLALSLLPM
ncbi:MAG: glycosyltransferase family 2 protein [Proteobacteria bacterium]|nr:glycosyltransferase family 2 protein [Pseudomonadota bacterium]